MCSIGAKTMGQKKALNAGSGETKNPTDEHGVETEHPPGKEQFANESGKTCDGSKSRSSAACDNASLAEVRVCSCITACFLGAAMWTFLARETKKSPCISMSTSLALPSQRNSLVSGIPSWTTARRSSTTWRHVEVCLCSIAVSVGGPVLQRTYAILWARLFPGGMGIPQIPRSWSNRASVDDALTFIFNTVPTPLKRRSVRKAELGLGLKALGFRGLGLWAVGLRVCGAGFSGGLGLRGLGLKAAQNVRFRGLWLQGTGFTLNPELETLDPT